ncbi:MAG: C39 family peptidase [Proteobacteria bacterium]|nr:C39 family peptidase [Pseudomonadota bacterium]
MRYTDRSTNQPGYPLSTRTAVNWAQCEQGFRTSLELPPCPAEHIIVPSLSMTGTPYCFQFSLRDEQNQAWQLNSVPAQTAAPAVPTDAPVTTHIDAWHTTRDLGASVLDVIVDRQPLDFLLTVSVRPLTIEPANTHAQVSLTRCPLPISQMQAPENIRHGICSPTSMAMLVDRPGRQGWLDLVAECRDQVTGMYGVWPLAIRAAAMAGRLGAVEVFSGWSDVMPALDAGHPVVASIRFAEGALPGAPLNKTGGHLVVVYGIEKEQVLVLDPAAPDHDSVARRYDIKAFSRAWFAHRGAGYILAA